MAACIILWRHSCDSCSACTYTCTSAHTGRKVPVKGSVECVSVYVCVFWIFFSFFNLRGSAVSHSTGVSADVKCILRLFMEMSLLKNNLGCYGEEPEMFSERLCGSSQALRGCYLRWYLPHSSTPEVQDTTALVP